MKVVFAVAFLFGAMYFLWWGYKNLLQRENDKGDRTVEGQVCHLCRRPFPITELVIREKLAGFENYFCGQCITSLMDDYTALQHKNEAAKLEEIASASEFVPERR
jgi:hypothetical protein